MSRAATARSERKEAMLRLVEDVLQARKERDRLAAENERLIDLARRAVAAFGEFHFLHSCDCAGPVGVFLDEASSLLADDAAEATS